MMKELPKEKDKAILVDVDGTIANDSHRFEFAKKPNGKINWDVYFRKDLVEKDKLNDELKDRLIKFKEDGHEIVFLTGRPEFLRKTTTDWLVNHDVPFDKLVMRSEDERYLDVTDYKYKEISKLKKDYNIIIAFDDLDEAIEAIEKNNIKYEKINFRK